VEVILKKQATLDHISKSKVTKSVIGQRLSAPATAPRKMAELLSEKYSKPVILLFIRHYFPGTKMGGPLTSIDNLVEALHDEFSFHIVTFDRDIGDSAAYDDIELGRWVQRGAYNIFYVRKNYLAFGEIYSVVKNSSCNVIYLNGYFSFMTTLYPLLIRRLVKRGKTPVLLAPRGVFSQGALKSKSAKKIAFTVLARFIRLHQGVFWHASSEHERDDINRVLGVREGVSVVPNLPRKVGRLIPKATVRDGSFKIVFASRITRMKNLDFAIDVLSGCKQAITFDIYGPKEDANYWELCKSKIVKLPDNIEVNYCRALLPHEVSDTIAIYDLMFLPTLGENFGHAIYEAMAAGTPILISNNTRWKSFPPYVGKALSLENKDEYSSYIDTIACQPAVDWAKVCEQTYDHALKLEATVRDVVSNRALFESICERS